jgi:hypothetical protein
LISSWIVLITLVTGWRQSALIDPELGGGNLGDPFYLMMDNKSVLNSVWSRHVHSIEIVSALAS